MAALPLAVLIACAGTAGASPKEVVAPSQPGVTTPNTPPGGTQSQPGITTPQALPSPAQDEAGIAPQSDYAEYRTAPQRSYTAPVRPEKLHAPVATPRVAPIKPPENTLRVGVLQGPTPEWMSNDVRDTINNNAARTEADITTYARSIGVSPSRSDHFASSVVMGGGVGAAVSLASGAVVIGGVPVGAVTGALIGGTIGGIAGAAAGTVVLTPGLGTVTSGVAGTAIGAAIGAAVGAGVGAAVSAAFVPCALLGVPVGVAIGAAVGVS